MKGERERDNREKGRKERGGDKEELKKVCSLPLTLFLSPSSTAHRSPPSPPLAPYCSLLTAISECSQPLSLVLFVISSQRAGKRRCSTRACCRSYRRFLATRT